MNPEKITSPQNEVLESLRQQAIVKHMEKVNKALGALNNEELKQYENNNEEIESFTGKLMASESVHRLGGLQQQEDVHNLDKKPKPQIMGTPALHTRFDHSETMAINAEMIGARLNMSTEEIKQLVAACWLHDVGQSAFSHTGDAILKDIKRDSHEERSVTIIKNDSNVREILSSTDIENVIKIIREQGSLGTLQSAIDTISYLEMDGENLGTKVIAARHFIRDIKGFDRATGTIIVEKPELWQELLDSRARAMKEFYYARPKKIAEEATRQLLRIAVKENIITLDDIEHTDDYTLWSKLQTLAEDDVSLAKIGEQNSDERFPEQYKDLYAFSIGSKKPEGWHIVECNSKLEAEQMLGHLPVEEIPSSFIVSPYNYTKKTLNIKDEKTGKTQTLRTSITLDPGEEKFLVCYKQLN